MSRRETNGIVATGAVATAVGLVTWLVTMASAPRYSDGAEQDLGHPALLPVLLAAALAGGFVARRRPGLIGLGLGLPGLLLSPWTAPRGDDDGLWLLIIPCLALFVVVLIGAAWVGCQAGDAVIRGWRWRRRRRAGRVAGVSGGGRGRAGR
jgi:hypothetical protein